MNRQIFNQMNRQIFNKMNIQIFNKMNTDKYVLNKEILNDLQIHVPDTQKPCPEQLGS